MMTIERAYFFTKKIHQIFGVGHTEKIRVCLDLGSQNTENEDGRSTI